MTDIQQDTEAAELHAQLVSLTERNNRQAQIIEEQNERINTMTMRVEDLLVQTTHADEDFERIADRLNVEAEDRGWCSDYDTILEEINNACHTTRLKKRVVEETLYIELRVEVKAGGRMEAVRSAVTSYLYNHLDNSSEWRQVAENNSVVPMQFIVRNVEIQTED